MVLLLTAESSELLLPTIVSRCEAIRLRPLPLDAFQIALKEKWGWDAEEARRLAKLSHGRPGYARFLESHPDIVERQEERLDEQIALLASDRAARFAYVEQLYRDSDRTRSTLQSWLGLWRDVFRQAAGVGMALTHEDRRHQIESLAEKVGLDGARRALRSLDRTLAMVDKNVNRRLALEVLMLDLPRV